MTGSKRAIIPTTGPPGIGAFASGPSIPWQTRLTRACGKEEEIWAAMALLAAMKAWVRRADQRVSEVAMTGRASPRVRTTAAPLGAIISARAWEEPVCALRICGKKAFIFRRREGICSQPAGPGCHARTGRPRAAASLSTGESFAPQNSTRWPRLAC
ncbi:MAG: hypothetical protein A2X40_03045 [Elusimicrobia bacterium GWC2_65_9]|nr:MAG: hypothetical protein A2X40_03045 [Elusimicrobia bacterium GWC2_65_9]